MSETLNVRPQWWLPACIACGVLFVIGLFVPNNTFGWLLVLVAVIGGVVLAVLEYKRRHNAAKPIVVSTTPDPNKPNVF